MRPPVSTGELIRIADAVPAALAVYNLTTAQYLYVNQAVTAVLGYSPEEFLEGGLGFVVSLVHADDVQGLLADNQVALDNANQRLAEDGEPIAAFEYRMRHKDGRYLWVKTHGTVFGRSLDGSVELILNVTLDITEHKQTELGLRRQVSELKERVKRMEGRRRR